MSNLENSQHLSARWFIIMAFMSLLSVYPFEKITVQQIVKKAGVSRSTFYLHFQDKYDLLSQQTEGIIGEFLHFYKDPNLSSERTLRKLSKEQIFPVTLKICRHIQFHKSFYIERFKDPEFVSYLTKRLHLELQKHLHANTLASFAAYGTVGFIGKWLEEELQTSAKEIAMQLENIGLSLLPPQEINY